MQERFDDKLNNFTHECALIDQDARHEAEKELMDLRASIEDEPTKEALAEGRAKALFIKKRLALVTLHLTALEKLFKGTQMEGEHELCSALSGLKAEIEFARYW